ncbi:MAG: protein kinase [Planctomycetes bacterium]|nr:protein kinase [Planctomycetota bacterium]
MSMDNLPSIIGNCRLISKVGQGGMGAVYRATHETLGREVAIKMLPTEFTQQNEYIQRFLREARAAAQLKHPNIVQVYDAGEQGGRYYIAMEFVDGTSLSATLKERGPLSETDGLRLMIHAAHGLAAAHALNLVHRDIKPENLMLGKDGVLKIADFGLVTAIRKDEHLTQDGAMLGTPAYMSPEQCEGVPADSRSDIYSLGATFYRLMTGNAPFSAATPIGVLFKHKHEPAPDARSVNPAISEATAQVLLKMMAKRPEDRFQSAAEVAALAEAILQGQRPVIHLPAQGPGVSVPGSTPSVGMVSQGTGGIHSAPTHAYTPAPAGAANTPTWMPQPVASSVTPMPSGATPGMQGVYTPVGIQAVTPSQFGPTLVSGAQPAVVPGTTIMQPPPRSAAGLIAAAAVIFFLLLAGGAYYGLVLYPQGQIEQAMRKAQDMQMLKQYEAAIQTLEAANARYPDANELKAKRDAIEAVWIQERVAKLKESARASLELSKHDDAVKACADALALEVRGKTLPGFSTDEALPALKRKAEDLRDFTKFMDMGAAAMKDKRFPDAVAAYQEAVSFEAKPGREAATAATRASFEGYLADETKYEKQMNFPAALEAANKAAELKVEDIAQLQERIKKRIQHDKTVADAEAEQKNGNLRAAATKLEQAAAIAPDDSAGEVLRSRAHELVAEADYQDGMTKGKAALLSKKWVDAEAAFKLAEAAKPKDPLATKLHGQALAGALADKAAYAAQAHNWQEAVQMYRGAAEQDPENAEYAQGALEAEKKIAEIDKLSKEARDAEAGAKWEDAAAKYTILAGLDGTQKTTYEQRANNAKFESAMGKSRALAASGKLDDALKAAQSAMTYDPTGGQKAQVEIEALKGRIAAMHAAASREKAVETATQLVRDGKITAALGLLSDAAKADPGNNQTSTLKLSLEDVAAIEKAYTRLEEIRQDARAAIDMALTCDKDDKKMNSWKASVDEWKDKIADGKAAARGAWLERKFDDIKPAYDGMRAKAQEMAQLYTTLAANFHGKAASAAKPKANIGGLVGGYGRGTFGGVGASGDIGDNQKHAGIYDGSAKALERCAEDARRFSVSE